MNINTMSDRLEQLEQPSNDAACGCSDLREGRNKTPEVGTDAACLTAGGLTWSADTRYSQRADTGHRVSAAKGMGGWLYSAWGPDRAPGVHYHDAPDALGAREHYKRGEHVPQRFPCLGHFRSAEQARAACEADSVKERSRCK